MTVIQGRMMLRFKVAIYALISFLFSSSLFATWQVGVAKNDITGAAAEIGMMGYAKLGQKAQGIHSRLWARAFVFKSLPSERKVAIVNADLGMVFPSIKQDVIKKLQQRLGQEFDETNVLIAATHTHSGSGGYAFHTLYNITIGGFYGPNHQVIVEGITQAIITAYQKLRPANIYINQGELTGASTNRSLPAYYENPIEEQGKYQSTTDNQMVLLKIEDIKHQPLAMLNWFAIHGVSMSNKNKLISSDNKGYAAYLTEKKFKNDNPSFIAGFMQANEGDVSANIFHDPANSKCQNFDCADFKHLFTVGEKQFQKALELYHAQAEPIKESLDYRFQYLDMSNQRFSDSKGEDISTCEAALGYAFGAGTSDGAGMDIFHQGQLYTYPLVNLLRDAIASPSQKMKDCQSPKPILLAVGLMKHHPWVVHQVPIQIIQLGQLAIVAAPGEFTTMAGRRIKQQLLKTLAPEVKYIAFSGLANSYSGYVTTQEEYAHQNYEGASTLYGPHTLAAYQHGFEQLAISLKNHTTIELGEKPKNFSPEKASVIPAVLFDDKPINRHFGSLHQEPKSYYYRGEVVHVAFWSGHPRNHFETGRGFLEVQKKVNADWQTLYYDWDFNTLYRWQRYGISFSLAHIDWQTSDEDKLGQYRIVHHGHYKDIWSGKIYGFSGYTREFELR